MKKVAIFLTLAALCVCVALFSGCSTQNVKDVLGNLDKDCVRHYQGSAGTGAPIGNATITFTIDCRPSGVTEPAK